MTAPIQEPSVYRTQSGQGWNIAQLARRPRPSAEAVGPTALRALRDYGTGLVVATATETVLTFDQWENEDATIFDETLFSGDLQKVSFMAQGVYTVTIKINWETQFDGITEICWLDDSTTAGNWPFGGTGTVNYGQFGEGQDSNSFTYPLTMSITDKFPRYTTTPANVSGGIYGQIFVKVMQRSGSNKDLSSAQLNIFYWGTTLTSI